VIKLFVVLYFVEVNLLVVCVWNVNKVAVDENAKVNYIRRRTKYVCGIKTVIVSPKH